MENVENNKSEIEFLKEQLERVNYWLSFGEAKNGALIVINLALMALIVDLFSYAPVVCTIILIFLTISSALCLFSFVPVFSVQEKEADNVDLKKINLLFYADIATLSRQQYIDTLEKKYKDIFKKPIIKSDIELDYVSEIYENSRIAKNKYFYFKKAVYIDFLALFGSVIMFIIA